MTNLNDSDPLQEKHALYIVDIQDSYARTRHSHSLLDQVVESLPHLELGPDRYLVADADARDGLLAFNAPDEGYLVVARRATREDLPLLEQAPCSPQQLNSFVQQIDPSFTPPEEFDKEQAMLVLTQLLA